MRQKDLYRVLLLISGFFLSTCQQPTCPGPNFTITPLVKINACVDPPVRITSCALRLLESINRILYAREHPDYGLAYPMCPVSATWKPDEVAFSGQTFNLFTSIEACGSMNIDPHAAYIMVAHNIANEYNVALYNAREDFSYRYYGFCVPDGMYKADHEYDVSQCFSFYYLEGTEIVKIPVKNIVSVKSVTLDCSLINTSLPGFFYSSYGISVELNVKNMEGALSGAQTIDAYIMSSGQNGNFSAWTGHVQWKDSI